ncbi:MAG TPA: hypothetical protein PL009_00820 [Flavipsychrobacter sp.]|nr:hypothetical protein [Flavipsychrobacter sp.]
MKKLILLIAVSAVAFVNANAQDFKQALQKTWNTFDTTKENSARVEMSNKLGLISKKWPDEWAAHFYNALSKAILSYNETNEAKRDAYLDEAEREREETVSLLKKENDETYVLAAMIANARLAVKPQSRWQKYGKIFDENIAKAKELNPNNPRIYYLQGTSKRFTPKMFGGGKKASLPYFEKAESLFAKENSEDVTTISWGKRINETFLKDARGEETDGE